MFHGSALVVVTDQFDVDPNDSLALDPADLQVFNPDLGVGVVHDWPFPSVSCHSVLVLRRPPRDDPHISQDDQENPNCSHCSVCSSAWVCQSWPHSSVNRPRVALPPRHPVHVAVRTSSVQPCSVSLPHSPLAMSRRQSVQMAMSVVLA